MSEHPLFLNISTTLCLDSARKHKHMEEEIHHDFLSFSRCSSCFCMTIVVLSCLYICAHANRLYSKVGSLSCLLFPVFVSLAFRLRCVATMTTSTSSAFSAFTILTFLTFLYAPFCPPSTLHVGESKLLYCHMCLFHVLIVRYGSTTMLSLYCFSHNDVLKNNACILNALALFRIAGPAMLVWCMLRDSCTTF